MLTYQDLCIQELDQNFIDRICDKYDIRYNEIEVCCDFNSPNFSTATFTNAVITGLLEAVVKKHITNEHDKELLIDSIFVNGFDSGYDIRIIDKLRTKAAKDLVRNVK